MINETIIIQYSRLYIMRRITPFPFSVVEAKHLSLSKKMLPMPFLLLLFLQFTSASPFTVRASLGQETVALPCVANAKPSETVLWISAENITISRQSVNNRSSIDAYNNLIIKNVTFRDHGMYICNIRGKKGFDRHSVWLNVLFQPFIYIERDNVSALEVLERSTVKFNCTAHGNPLPKIIWRRKTPYCNGIVRSVSYLDAKTVVSSFELLNVTRNCFGYFECFAGNGIFPNAFRKIKVQVMYPPVLSARSSVVRVSPYTLVAFSCLIEAYPLPTQAFWEFQNRPVQNNSPFLSYTRVLTETSTVLYMSIYRMYPEYFGIYTCVGINSLGKSSKTIDLQKLALQQPAQFKLNEGNSFSDEANITLINETAPQMTTVLHVLSKHPSNVHESSSITYSSYALNSTEKDEMSVSALKPNVSKVNLNSSVIATDYAGSILDKIFSLVKKDLSINIYSEFPERGHPKTTSQQRFVTYVLFFNALFLFVAVCIFVILIIRNKYCQRAKENNSISQAKTFLVQRKVDESETL